MRNWLATHKVILCDCATLCGVAAVIAGLAGWLGWQAGAIAFGVLAVFAAYETKRP